jgi:hypothetical protein
MSNWLRPLTYIGLEVIPPGLMIITNHPWMGAATFVGVLAASLIHSSIRTGAVAAREREILSYARHANDIGEDPTPVVRALRQVDGRRDHPGTDADPDADAYAEEWVRPRGKRDGLIHYPPRRTDEPDYFSSRR